MMTNRSKHVAIMKCDTRMSALFIYVVLTVLLYQYKNYATGCKI
jgi:hypothetical protein